MCILVGALLFYWDGISQGVKSFMGEKCKVSAYVLYKYASPEKFVYMRMYYN